jgi:hypothetical protein
MTTAFVWTGGSSGTCRRSVRYRVTLGANGSDPRRRQAVRGGRAATDRSGGARSTRRVTDRAAHASRTVGGRPRRSAGDDDRTAPSAILLNKPPGLATQGGTALGTGRPGRCSAACQNLSHSADAAAFNDSRRSFHTRFYDRHFHGRDWSAIRKRYEPLLDSVGTRDEFATLLNMMVGELEASHTEVGPAPGPEGPQTRYLGVTFDYEYAGRASGSRTFRRARRVVRQDAHQARRIHRRGRRQGRRARREPVHRAQRQGGP